MTRSRASLGADGTGNPTRLPAAEAPGLGPTSELIGRAEERHRHGLSHEQATSDVEPLVPAQQV